MHHRVITLAIAVVCALELASAGPARSSPAGGTHSPMRLAASATTQALPGVASDGAGGSFLAWIDRSGADNLIYAQRVTPDGYVMPGWPDRGVLVSASSGDYANVSIVSDGAADGGGNESRIVDHDTGCRSTRMDDLPGDIVERGCCHLRKGDNII